MKKDTLTEMEKKENEREEKIKKELACKFIRIILMQKMMIFLMRLVKYKITLLNQIKKSLIDDLSKRLLELEFNSNH